MFKSIIKKIRDAKLKVMSTPDKFFAGEVCDGMLLDAPGKYYRQILCRTKIFYDNGILYFKGVEPASQELSDEYFHSTPIEAVKSVGHQTYRLETKTSSAYVICLQ